MTDIRRYVAPNDPQNPFYDDGTVDYERVQGTNPLVTEYPKMMYQAGGTEEHHGHMVATRVAHDDVEEEALIADGWRGTPAKAAALGKALVEDGTPDRPRRGRPPNNPVASLEKGE